MDAPYATRFRTNRRGLTLVTAFLALLALAVVAAPAMAADMSDRDQTGLNGPELIQALRNGGYVIYFRHAETDHSQTDSDRVNLKNCDTQRNLSTTGRDQARAIGRAFQALGIPIARVESSPYCRCVETGRLAFGDVTISDLLGTVISESREQTAESAAALRERLAETPSPGTNTVLVSHTANLKEATGVWPDPEGAAVVFRPQGPAGFSLVATVPPEQWAAWASLHATPGPRVRDTQVIPADE